MAGPVYFTQEDLESRFGVQRVQQVFSDSGKLELSARFDNACKVASRKVEQILGTSWEPEQVAQLIAGDEAVLASGCDLVMADGMKTGRPEWSAGDGSKAPYVALKLDAEKDLRTLADGYNRSRAEREAGANPQTRAAIVSPRNFMFNPTADRPRRGGF
jgi:hypothetical protein